MSITPGRPAQQTRFAGRELRIAGAQGGSDLVIGGDESGGSPALLCGGRVEDVRIHGRAPSDQAVASLASG